MMETMIGYSLFSGAGGFDLGLEMARFDGVESIQVVVATDIDEAAAKTYRHNWSNTPFLCKDARQVQARELLELANGQYPDIVFGGPPCQGFSTLGDKLSSDPRNNLFDEFARLVFELHPQYVLMENVRSLVTMYRGQYKDYIIQTFQKMGYTMYQAILNASDYGVPQIRNRVIFFGTKSQLPFAFPVRTHGNSPGLQPYETVGQWIADLAHEDVQFNGHVILNHSKIVVDRYRLIPEGGTLPKPSELPPEIRRTNFGNTYKRLNRNAPALTLVPGNNAFPIHPWLHRSLTPREAARLQSFPDHFEFVGDRRKQCILVGNAVPPLLAEALGKSVLQHAAGLTHAITQPLEKMDDLSSEVELRQERLIHWKNLESKKMSGGFIDLFCGAGGLTIGFSRAGWKPLLCVDANAQVAKTHQFNLPDVPFLTGDLSSSGIQESIARKFKDQDVGLVVGGPPCQGFSIFGKRRFINTQEYKPSEDPRNKLVYAYLDIIQAIHPRWFVMENVAGLTSLDDGLFFEEIMNAFRALGYDNIEARVLNMADYGVPQLRKRLFIIGNRTGHIIPWPKKKFFATPQDWQDKYRTVGEVISDLATEASLQKYTCHVPMKHKPLLVERYTYIPEGGKLNVEQLPPHLKVGYRTQDVQNFSHVFKRLHRDFPSITIVPGHNALPIHPWLNRALTVREAARIQTFPDELIFQGSRQEQCIQVGNAVPPLFAELLANNIRKAEQNGWYPNQVPKSAYYALVEKGESIRLKASLNPDQDQLFLKEKPLHEMAT
jgi:DNA (cytosine-5)-methyltransferase 1